MKKVLTIVGLVGLSCVGSSASAALLTYEGFDYTSGQLLAPATNPGTNGQNGGTGWSSNTTNTSTTGAVAPNGAWQESNVTVTPVISAGGLSYTDGLGNQLQVSGNAANINSGATHDGAIRALGSTYSSASNFGTSVWGSVLAQYTRTPLTENRYFQLNLYNGTAAAANIGKIGTNTFWQIQPQGGTAGPSDDSVGNLSLLVYRIDFVSPTVTNYSLFVNPTLGGAAPITADATTTGGALTFNAIRLQGNGTGLFDEIRLGDTFADVTPVPEPGSIAMLGGLGLLALKRRRRVNGTV